MANNGEPPTSEEKQQCRTSLLEHWAEARIDGPMQAIARYDNVAKLLITIGGFLQAVLAAVYALMLKEPNAPVNTLSMRIILVVDFASLILFFIFAAIVCLPQPKMQAEQLLKSKQGDDLNKNITDWCKDIDEILEKKRFRLKVATSFFVFSSLLMIWLLLNPLNLHM